MRAAWQSIESTVPTKYWHRLDEGRVQCDLCPRFCKLHEGQRAFRFVGACEGGQIVLRTYGRSSGFWVNPICHRGGQLLIGRD